MSELSLHRIKKISINHEFCESKGDYHEFATIRIDVEAPEDRRVKEFQIMLFINPDTEFTFNGLLAYQRGMEPKKNEPVEENPLDEAITVNGEMKKEGKDGGNE